MREFDIAEGDFEIASMAWEAYRAPTPELCAGLLDRPLGKLSFVKPAMEDLLAELPSSATGLGATEARLLELIASGHNRTDALFRPGALGSRVFDPWELGALLEGLAFGPAPAIAGLDGKLATLDPDNARGRNAAFRRSRLSLTKWAERSLKAGRISAATTRFGAGGVVRFSPTNGFGVGIRRPVRWLHPKSRP